MQSSGTNKYFNSALALREYLERVHWNGKSLEGPDPGIRFNTRIGRFIKSYSSLWPWKDNVVYMQAQGYWIFSNWQSYDLTADPQAKSVALECSNTIVALQTDDGYWAYPNREWKDRIATVEGCFASLGLLESYSRSGDPRYLDSAIRWYEYLISDIGFREQDDSNMWAVNYFAHRHGKGGGVPNNSTLLLWFLARLHQLSNDSRFLEPCEKTVTWLRHVQLPTGELPYALGRTADADRIHFLCFQYNAFELMDLIHYLSITGDHRVRVIIERLAGYLATGLTRDGRARFDCLKNTPDVLYYTVAVGRALSVASASGFGDFRGLAESAFEQALAAQEADGSFAYHSQQNYGFLKDRRSYPRYLSMVLHHLLGESQNEIQAHAPQMDLENVGEN